MGFELKTIIVILFIVLISSSKKLLFEGLMYCKSFGWYDWDLLLEKSLHSDLNEAYVMHLTLGFILIDMFHGGSRDYLSDLGGALGGVFAYFFFK